MNTPDRHSRAVAPASPYRGFGLVAACALVGLELCAVEAQAQPKTTQPSAPVTSSGASGATAGAPAAPAVAGDPSAPASRKEAAEALKIKGDAFFRGRNYVDAVASYEESYSLFADPRVLYNKGRALQALGRYGEALSVLRTFEKEAPELKSQIAGLDGLIQELAVRVCEVTLHANLEGAQIILGTEVVGVTPLSAPLSVNAGHIRLQVVKEGYFPFDREVVLEGNGHASFDVTLESKSRHAKLTITSRLPGTTVWVDGKRVGQAPSEVVLTAGAHRVQARKEGYEESSSQVVLEVGQNRSMAIDPQPKQSPLYRKWWFWAAAGVVVAATAATVMATREPTVTKGDFSPDTVSAPLLRF